MTAADPMTPPGLQDANGLVALARRSAHRRMNRWPHRRLSPGERALMWLLRLYVFAMLGVVSLQIIRLA